MATYYIGDLQGCFDTFQALLSKVDFQAGRDRLRLAGDLVNRGPKSAETLEWIYKNRQHVQCVLGNHDMYFLFRSFGGEKKGKGDTLDSLLSHRESKRWRDWLCKQPLFLEFSDGNMVHAGLHPSWSLDQVKDLTKAIQSYLSGNSTFEFLKKIFEHNQSDWVESLTGADRAAVAANIFTRIRVCDIDGNVDKNFEGGLSEIGKGYYPWYEVPNRVGLEKRTYFGHWAALGLLDSENVTCLDSGCVWGRTLTAVRAEDRAVFQQQAVD